MSKLAWSDEMSVGVRELDDEHKTIVDLLNQLHDGILAGNESKALVGIFTTLILETKKHLAHEERLLAQTNFPNIQEHHKAHDAVLCKGLILQARFMSGSTEPFTMEAFHQARSWLETHILDLDKEYEEHLNAHGIF